MYYFNIKSLIDDPNVKELSNSENLSEVLVDNNLRIIGNRKVYADALIRNDKYVTGRRLNRNTEFPVFPESVGIEISSKCNYHCKMCPRRSLDRESIHMRPELFYKVIDEISKNKVNMLGLYRLGESLTHPRFFEFLEYVGNFDSLKNSFLSTNGGLLNDEVIDRLLSSNLRFLNISLNALERDTYKQITGRDEFEHVKSICNEIKGRKKKRTPFVSFQFLEQDLTAGQVKSFVSEYVEYADFVESSVLEDFGGQLKNNVKFLESQIYPGVGNDDKPCQRSKWGMALIYSNGDVVPCICDINAKFIKVGNMFESSLKEIYESESWAQFREMQNDGSFIHHPLCGQCLDRKIYG